MTVAHDLGDQIMRGRLKPGERLPMTAQLCATYGVSALAVRNAMLGLKASGLVTGVPGVGVFVSVRPVPRRRAHLGKPGHPRPKRRR